MQKPPITEQIVREVLLRLQTHTIPIAVSARHVHLSQQHLSILFGSGHELKKKRELSQPGQFAAAETVLLAGPRGCIERVRVLGPCRRETQVEISRTDALRLGVAPPVRESGDTKGSAAVTIIGPAGSLFIKEGCIVAQRHIHMSPQDAQTFQVQNGELVQVEVQGERPLLFQHVRVRVSPRYQLEMHIDTDEANAAGVAGTGRGILRRKGGGPAESRADYTDCSLDYAAAGGGK
ncbi:phosphate propanoyltransferase [Ectobacillus ponti]|uniref:Phosphate propanoyltransferase n=1 Tax=Ectobacillus ponti TaxID=2961894 RepID=A0AA42BQZ2_9BACI|nr:phosphate propanoyltransferase [Ectobacillus ponti]MCP8970407.1 phosphate propanoyltransferase [Ectobacillus ponti]